MERRKVLKQMGWAMGLTVATPSILSLLQSCQQEGAPQWTPVFFSEEQGGALMTLVDLIIPRTDTPSASDVQVHSFLDLYMNEVSSKEEQALMSMAFTAFLNKALTDSGKEAVADLGPEDLEPVLAAALAKKSPEEEEAANQAMAAYFQAAEAGEAAILDEGVARSMFANNLRGAVIWAYKTSETIGEEVLAYLPVPGQYVPCASVEELTGGKAWSI